jgi:hypothetical protein
MTSSSFMLDTDRKRQSDISIATGKFDFDAELEARDHIKPFSRPLPRNHRVDSGRSFQPYNLVVVQRTSLDPNEHFVLSSSGVVHVRKDNEAEVTALGEWHRERVNFLLLTQINFFKNYLIGKTYRTWHKVWSLFSSKHMQLTLWSYCCSTFERFLCRRCLNIGHQIYLT